MNRNHSICNSTESSSSTSVILSEEEMTEFLIFAIKIEIVAATDDNCDLKTKHFAKINNNKKAETPLASCLF